MAKLYKCCTGKIQCTADNNDAVNDESVGIGNWCIVEDSYYSSVQHYVGNTIVNGVFILGEQQELDIETEPTYAELRQNEILETWPLTRQAEAMTEYYMGRPELQQQLLAFIQEVKNKYPKPEVEANASETM